VTQQTKSAPPVVRLNEGKNLDKTIDLARFGAAKDKVTVIIERTFTTKKGDPRRIPILEITPSANIQEILAPRLRTSIAAHLAEADLALRLGDMNRAKGNGHLRFAELVKLSRDYMAAKREWDEETRAQKEASRKQRKQARRNRQQPRRAA
jgi:hypothetical protein